jgi:hypothetical protein
MPYKKPSGRGKRERFYTCDNDMRLERFRRTDETASYGKARFVCPLWINSVRQRSRVSVQSHHIEILAIGRREAARAEGT